MLTYLSAFTGSYEQTEEKTQEYTVRVRVSFEADIEVCTRDEEAAEALAVEQAQHVCLFRADAEIREVDVFPCLTRRAS
jgi:RNase H-fold protein (predicted Holliday junction resolvase)